MLSSLTSLWVAFPCCSSIKPRHFCWCSANDLALNVRKCHPTCYLLTPSRTSFPTLLTNIPFHIKTTLKNLVSLSILSSALYLAPSLFSTPSNPSLSTRKKYPRVLLRDLNSNKFTYSLFFKKNFPRMDYPARLRFLHLLFLQQRITYLYLCTFFKPF